MLQAGVALEPVHELCDRGLVYLQRVHLPSNEDTEVAV